MIKNRHTGYTCCCCDVGCPIWLVAWAGEIWLHRRGHIFCHFRISHLQPPIFWSFSTSGVNVFQFWARRIRRLLPIAFLVVAATSIVVLVVLPLSERVEFGKQAIASVLYLENWVLALDSVQYLNADYAPTAVQQYWSLSVEEQFSILWPLLLIEMLAITRRIRAKFSSSIFITLFVRVFLSLSFSILLGITNNPSGYFNTFSRIWEFGFGAICAFLVLKTTVISKNNLLRVFSFVAGYC